LLTTHAYASRLAETNGARLVLVPGVGHSWPKADAARFLRFIDELVRGRASGWEGLSERDPREAASRRYG
jgi:hypothetical protein